MALKKPKKKGGQKANKPVVVQEKKERYYDDDDDLEEYDDGEDNVRISPDYTSGVKPTYSFERWKKWKRNQTDPNRTRH